MMPRRGFRAINTRPPLNNVQIDFHEPFLAENEIHVVGERDFEDFAEVGGPIPEEEIFRGLHRDRTAAAFRSSAGHGIDCFVDRAPIYAPVLAKLRILGGYYLCDEIWGDAVKIAPAVTNAVAHKSPARHQG